MLKSRFYMILVLNDLCPQNLFIGGPWAPGGPGHHKILAAVYGEVWRPHNFKQIYNNLKVYFKRIRKNKNFINFFIIYSKFSLNFQNSLIFSINF